MNMPRWLPPGKGVPTRLSCVLGAHVVQIEACPRSIALSDAEDVEQARPHEEGAKDDGGYAIGSK